MNRFLAWTVSLAAALSFMAGSGAAQTSSYKGETTDEHLNCVQTPVKAVEGVTTGQHAFSTGRIRLRTKKSTSCTTRDQNRLLLG